MCLPWQHWTEALVWFDDVDISAFHSCVVVDLWQSLSEWHLIFLRVFWCAAARMSELELEQRSFLATKQITVLEHPAYSPDPATSDFFLFPNVKEILK